jgi:uncharacterized protein involved in exopolysaccharide biosynthesis
MSFASESWSPSISALDARSHLIQLQAERALAQHEGLGEIEAYMADLDAELEHQRSLYAAAVVTEIATLRGELFGRETG